MEIEAAMVRANELAQLGLGLVSPNPIVGAVILDSNGDLISTGFHQSAGGEHAEIVAIKSARSKLDGATLVVTLEPCNHQGKTPPCTEAIIEAGIKRVIYAIPDPNPVASGGAERLKSAGLEIFSGILSDKVSEANRAWLKKVRTGLPYLTMKIASTLDGKIAASDGTSKWITSDISRDDVAKLRSECDAIFTGTGTVLADNPKLTVRGVERPEITKKFSPTRVVLGQHEISERAEIFSPDAETIHLRTRDLNESLELAKLRGWNRILIEAGPGLSTAFLKANLVDEIFWYQAPAILGSGKAAIGDLGIASLTDRISFSLVDVHAMPGSNGDLRIHLRIGG